MFIDFIDKNIFYRKDFIEGAKLWNQIYKRFKKFSINSIINYYQNIPVSGLALYNNDHSLAGICIYVFDTPYGSEDKNMVINHFFVDPALHGTFIIGKFLKRIEQVAKSNKCSAILYPDCTFNNFFEKHPDKYKVLEITYKQEL